MSYLITFVVYRPNSADGCGDVVFDSLDSGLSIISFSSFQTGDALTALTKLFLDDLNLREYAKWIAPLEITVLIDGRALISDNRMFDANSLITQAQEAAKAQHEPL